MRISKRFGQLLLAALVVGAGLTATSQASLAATSTGRSDACGPLACGSATVVWGKYSLNPVRMSVNDTSCDGRQVGIQLQVESVGGQHYGGPVHWSSHNCHEGYELWPNLSFSSTWQIRSINVVVYVKSKTAGGGPTMYVGNRADNPLT